MPGLSVMDPPPDPRESVFNIFRNRKSKATPMKTLIAEEMSTEITPMKTLIAREIFSEEDHKGDSDSPNLVDERWQKSPNTMDERKMNLIRQMFIEAKRISKDEKLLQSKQITVLRPSKATNGNSNDSVGESYSHRDDQHIKKPEKSHFWTSPTSSLERGENSNLNSTQPTQIVVLKPKNNGKAMGSPMSGLGEDQEAREVKKEIMPYMHEKLGMHKRDESLSSVFSSGYIGDESSFNKSETEIMSPVSRRSWDSPDRFSSPYSSSLHAQAYYSPKFSVWRKAKKRLSKRLGTMTSSSSRSSQEQILFQRSPSGLSDMLALSETNKEEEKNMDYSPRILMRSKSVPVSGTKFETRLNVGFSKDKKEKSVKSSFRGRVSSLIYSRNKNPGVNKSFYSGLYETHSLHGEFCNEEGSGSDYASSGLLETDRIDKQGMMSPESGLTASEDAWGNHDQPSMVSALDTFLEENEHTAKILLHHVNPHEQHVVSGIEGSVNSIGSNLIDKSPPIESASIQLTGILTAPKTDEEQEWFFLVKALLSMSGLQGEAQPNSFWSRWHSPESPLDPSLRVSCIDDLSDEQQQKRSNHNLMFDCVTEVLINIAGYELESVLRVIRDGSCLLDEVWAQMKAHFYSQDECVQSGDSEVMAERLVTREVMGKGWDGCFRSEMDDCRIEIGEMVVEELVQEVVVELAGRNTDCDAVLF